MSKKRKFISDSFIFIGERPNEKEIKITGKPVFYDALYISKKLEAPQNTSTYESIPLIQEKSFCFYDNQLELTLQYNTLQIIDESQRLNESDAIKLFSSFMIKKQNRLLFISEIPNIKIRKTKKDHILKETYSKSLEE